MIRLTIPAEPMQILEQERFQHPHPHARDGRYRPAPTPSRIATGASPRGSDSIRIRKTGEEIYGLTHDPRGRHNARYPRHAFVMAEAKRLPSTLLRVAHLFA